MPPRNRESIQRLPSTPGSQHVGELIVRFRASWRNDPASRAAARAAVLDAQKEMLSKINNRAVKSDAPWHLVRRRAMPDAHGDLMVELWVNWTDRATVRRDLLAAAVKYLIDEIDNDALKGLAHGGTPQVLRDADR